MKQEITVEYILEKYHNLFSRFSSEEKFDKAKRLRELLYSVADLAVNNYFESFAKDAYNKSGIAENKIEL